MSVHCLSSVNRACFNVAEVLARDTQECRQDEGSDCKHALPNSESRACVGLAQSKTRHCKSNLELQETSAHQLGGRILRRESHDPVASDNESREICKITFAQFKVIVKIVIFGR